MVVASLIRMRVARDRPLWLYIICFNDHEWFTSSVIIAQAALCTCLCTEYVKGIFGKSAAWNTSVHYHLTGRHWFSSIHSIPLVPECSIEFREFRAFELNYTLINKQLVRHGKGVFSRIILFLCFLISVRKFLKMLLIL